jgi:hypothetical protein
MEFAGSNRSRGKNIFPRISKSSETELIWGALSKLKVSDIV